MFGKTKHLEYTMGALINMVTNNNNSQQLLHDTFQKTSTNWNVPIVGLG